MIEIVSYCQILMIANQPFILTSKTTALNIWVGLDNIMIDNQKIELYVYMSTFTITTNNVLERLGRMIANAIKNEQ